MAEFTIHIRLDGERCESADGEALLRTHVEANESVSFSSETVEPAPGTETLVPEQSALDIDGVETLANVYDDLRRRKEVGEVLLWGPESERFPVPVQHYALQQIQDPQLYEYHAVDDQVTLVIAESQLEAQRVRQEVPAAAIGYSESPF